MRKNRQTSIANINVTSLVDVTMVLLIIFMITAPLLRSNIEVNLPKISTETQRPREGVTVTYTKDGWLYINSEKISSDYFESILLQRYDAGGQKPVLLMADKEIPYGNVIAVMDRIKSIGINNIGLIVDSNTQKK